MDAHSSLPLDPPKPSCRTSFKGIVAENVLFSYLKTITNG
ncbi:MAG: hypothetical protein ACI81W_000759, partial [Saprospiraceae bacterium]